MVKESGGVFGSDVVKRFLDRKDEPGPRSRPALEPRLGCGTSQALAAGLGAAHPTCQLVGVQHLEAGAGRLLDWMGSDTGRW